MRIQTKIASKLFPLLLVTLAGGTPGCTADSGPGPKITALTIAANAGDRTILAMKLDDGQTITVFGDKDAGGYPKTITGAVIDTADQNPAMRTTIEYAAGGTTRVSSPNSGSLAIGPDTVASRSRVTLTSVDHQQVVTSTAAGRLSLPPRSGSDTANCTQGLVYVYCGGDSVNNLLDRSNVTGTYVDSNTGRSGPLELQQVSAGVWSYCLPSHPAKLPSAMDINKVIGFFSDCLGALCDAGHPVTPEALQVLCASLSAEPHAAVACDALGLFILKLCELFPAGLPSIDQSLLAGATSIINGYADLMTVYLTATANGFSGEKMLTLYPHPSTGMIQPAYFDFEGSGTLAGISTDPAAPDSCAGYTAYAEAFCAPMQSSLTLEITGQDGYHDQSTTLLFGKENRGSITVPGNRWSPSDTLRASLSGGGAQMITSVNSPPGENDECAAAAVGDWTWVAAASPGVDIGMCSGPIDSKTGTITISTCVAQRGWSSNGASFDPQACVLNSLWNYAGCSETTPGTFNFLDRTCSGSHYYCTTDCTFGPPSDCSLQPGSGGASPNAVSGALPAGAADGRAAPSAPEFTAM